MISKWPLLAEVIDCLPLSVEEIKITEKVLLAGIANPISFFNYLQQEKDTLAVFADHHHFTKSEIEAVDEKANGRIIVTTEKDYVRLKNHSLKNQDIS